MESSTRIQDPEGGGIVDQEVVIEDARWDGEASLVVVVHGDGLAATAALVVDPLVLLHQGADAGVDADQSLGVGCEQAGALVAGLAQGGHPSLDAQEPVGAV